MLKSSSDLREETFDRIAAYLTYQLVLHGTVITTLIFLEGGFIDHLARSWIIIAVLSLNTSVIKQRVLSLVIGVGIGAVSMLFYSWFAYSVLEVSSDAPLSKAYSLGVVFFLLGLAVAANWLAWWLFGYAPTAEFSSSKSGRSDIID